MQATIKISVHLLPLVPLVYGYYYLALACALAVGLCYVKVYKLTQQIEDHGPHDKSLVKAREFWRRLTFLKDRFD